MFLNYLIFSFVSFRNWILPIWTLLRNVNRKFKDPRSPENQIFNRSTLGINYIHFREINSRINASNLSKRDDLSFEHSSPRVISSSESSKGFSEERKIPSRKSAGRERRERGGCVSPRHKRGKSVCPARVRRRQSECQGNGRRRPSGKREIKDAGVRGKGVANKGEESRAP